jgi:hypothetical protein
VTREFFVVVLVVVLVNRIELIENDDEDDGEDDLVAAWPGLAALRRIIKLN